MIPIFNKVIGHQKQLAVFEQQFKNNRLPITALFYGIEGIGKKLMAQCIAAALFCPNKGCGTCSTCVRIMEHQHPDFFYVAPPTGKKGISIDMMRNLQKEISLKPHEAGQKFIVIDSADKMNEAAANSFLKTLEEPPKNTRIVLISDTKFALLPTILSRVQCIRFQPLNPLEIREFLVARLKRERVDFLVELSQGSIGNALALAETDLEQTRLDLCQWLRHFEEQESQKFIKRYLSFIPENLPTKEEARRYLAKQTEILILLFRDLTVIPYAIPIINRDQVPLLQSLSRKIFSELAQTVIIELYEYIQTLKRNVNIELVTETYFLRIHNLLKKV